MKKCEIIEARSRLRYLKKMLLIMRLTVVITLVLTIQASASVYSQATKMSLEMKNTSLEEVIDVIRDQSEFRFLYNHEEIEVVKNVDVKLKDASVEEILDEILADYDLDYRVVNKVVVITPAPGKTKSKEVNSNDAEQDKKVLTGLVTEEGTNVPLIGVNVFVKGTTVGAVTDNNGVFELEVLEEEGVVVFSYIGFEDQEHPYGENTVFTVVLKTAISSVDEVFVYGSGLSKISKERATGSYSVMTREEIESSPNEEIGQSLEGTITGLQENVNPNTGETEIAIRGIGTITSNAKPLIVVDGFPVEGDFSTINPNDIDNIQVLKDAAAASIWGARAGNGVIVVTTKKAKTTGKINVEVGSYLKIGEEMDMDYNVGRLSVANQLTYEKYLTDNDYGTNWGVPDNILTARTTYSKGVQAYWDAKRGVISGVDLDNILNKLRNQDYTSDVQKYLLRTPVTHQHNLSLNGRSEKASYALSVLFNNVKDHFQENQDQKVLINFRNSYQIKDWLRVNFNMVTEMKEMDNSGANIGTIRNISPYERLINDDGTYAQVDYQLNYSFVNPLARTAKGLPYKNWAYNPVEEMLNRDLVTKSVNTRMQTGLDIKIIEGLNFTPSFQFERFSTKLENYNGEDTYYARNLVNDNVVYDMASNSVTKTYVPMGGTLYSDFTDVNTYDLRNQINYDNEFGDHEINLVAAAEHIWKLTNGYSNMLYGFDPVSNTFANPPFGYGSSEVTWNAMLGNYGSSISSGNSLDYFNTRVFSFFANGAYTYKQKYTVTGSYRTDASNMIVDDPKFRYSPFWSLGGSWNAKKESFFSDVDYLDRLIVRGTFGVSGNTVTTASTVPVLYMYSQPSSRNGAFGGYVSDYGNPTLRWERINQLNVAVDFSLFDRLLYGSVEFYDKQSEDLLASVSVAPTYGTTRQTFNVAEVSNQGIELNLNSDLKFGELYWDTGLNFSHNKNEVTSLAVDHIYPRNISNSRYVEGYPVAPAFSWVYGGMNEDDIATIEGENGITYTMNENIGSNGEKGEEVLRNMGTFIAPTTVGFNNTFKFKNFTLRTVMVGKFGHVFRRSTFGYNMISRAKAFYHEDLNGIMDGKADEMGIPDLPNGFEYYSYRWSWYAPNLNTLVEDASHIRLKELYLGYDLPTKLATKVGFDNLRVFTHARNLGPIWTANDKGIDPEYVKGSRFNPGASYTFGFSLGF